MKHKKRNKPQGFGSKPYDAIYSQSAEPRSCEEVLAIVNTAHRYGMQTCLIESICLSPEEMSKLQASYLPVETHIGGNTWQD